jgi:ABC-2 type transport system permease protein
VAVYKRTYTGYDGPLTPEWSRFLILPRTTYAKLSESRLLTTLRNLAFVYPLGCLIYVYLANNLSVLTDLGIAQGQAARFLTVDSTMFLYFCWIQGAFAYIMTALVGPSLVSPDLVNNALPLYLCRPFSRTEYVLGKMSVLGILLSIATWVPGLVVFTAQASLAGWDWTVDNAWIAGSVVVGLGLWVVLLSLIALAVSAFVKWRIAAGAVLLGIFVAGAGFGTALNQIVRTQYGSLLNLTQVMYTIWSQLFGQSADTGLSAGEAWSVVAVVCAVCVWLLSRKIRAFEVVK